MFKRLFTILYAITISTVAFSQDKTTVDYISDFTELVKQGDSTIIKLLGNVSFYHNGTFITCDSAYRYSEKKIEAIGDVIINQDALYIYGDKVLYNGETNIAKVFSPLIKAVDSSIVMYTRHMSFDTKNKIGEFYGGATIRQGEKNLLESENGYYYIDPKNVIMKNFVEIDSEDYEMKNEEVGFDMKTEKVTFDVPTNIWNKDSTFLSADEGSYDKANKIYNFVKNSYFLSEEQEGWADSMIYYSPITEVLMRQDIQMVDETQKMISFGDYGYYWGNLKNIISTKNPTLVLYEEGQDSVFISSDTILVYPYFPKIRTQRVIDSLLRADSLHIADSINKLFLFKDSIRTDSVLRMKILKDSLIIDGLRDILLSYDGYDTLSSKYVAKKVKTDTSLISIDSLSNNFKIIDNDKFKIIGDSIKEIYFKGLNITTKDSIIIYPRPEELSIEDIKKITKIELDSIFTPKDIFRLRRKNLKYLDKKVSKAIRRKVRKFRKIYSDSIAEARRDERQRAMLENINKVDTVAVDSIVKDTTEEEVKKIKIKNVPDSSDYILKALHNARIYRTDMQALGDTIIVETVDTTATLLGKPAIMWNEENQIVGTKIRAYVENGTVSRARFFGSPIVSQRVDEEKFNQLNGDYMDAIFLNQALNKLLINKSSKTFFYKQEVDSIDNSQYVSALIKTTSVNMIIYFEESQIDRIKWIKDIESTTFPIEKIPASEEQLLPEFVCYDSLRPKKKEVFDRVVRPSIRKKIDTLSRPKYPITSELAELKRLLLESGYWFDRTDKISVTKEDFKK
ncbi:MAG: hypothetical protein IMY73_03435 [Bacteroidetes bacterium]|nr:hypothetical protein [Bacteroidota bacterium]